MTPTNLSVRTLRVPFDQCMNYQIEHDHIQILLNIDWARTQNGCPSLVLHIMSRQSSRSPNFNQSPANKSANKLSSIVFHQSELDSTSTNGFPSPQTFDNSKIHLSSSQNATNFDGSFALTENQNFYPNNYELEQNNQMISNEHYLTSPIAKSSTNLADERNKHLQLNINPISSSPTGSSTCASDPQNPSPMSHTSSMSSSIQIQKEIYCDCNTLHLHDRHEASCSVQTNPMPMSIDTPRSQSQSFNQVSVQMSQKYAQNESMTVPSVMPKKNQKKHLAQSTSQNLCPSEPNYDVQQLMSSHIDQIQSLTSTNTISSNTNSALDSHRGPLSDDIAQTDNVSPLYQMPKKTTGHAKMQKKNEKSTSQTNQTRENSNHEDRSSSFYTSRADSKTSLSSVESTIIIEDEPTPTQTLPSSKSIDFPPSPIRIDPNLIQDIGVGDVSNTGATTTSSEKAENNTTTSSPPFSRPQQFPNSKRKTNTNNKHAKVVKNNRTMTTNHPLSSNFEQLPNHPTSLPIMTRDMNSSNISQLSVDDRIIPSVETPTSHMEMPINLTDHNQGSLLPHNGIYATGVSQHVEVHQMDNMYINHANFMDYAADLFPTGSVEAHLTSIQNDVNCIMVPYHSNVYDTIQNHFDNQTQINHDPLSLQNNNTEGSVTDANSAFHQSVNDSQLSNGFLTLRDFQVCDLPNSFSLPIAR